MGFTVTNAKNKRELKIFQNVKCSSTDCLGTYLKDQGFVFENLLLLRAKKQTDLLGQKDYKFSSSKYEQI